MRFQTRPGLRAADPPGLRRRRSSSDRTSGRRSPGGMPSLSSVRRAGRCDLLDQPDDLELLGCGVSHASSLPIPDHAFFEQAVLQGQIGHDLLQRLRPRRRSSFTSRAGRRARRVAGQPPLAGLEELLRPAVVQARRDPLAPAELGDAVLAAQALQHDADLLLGRMLLARRAAGCPSRPARPALWLVRISVSSSLLGGYDEPEILRSCNHPNLSHGR